MKRTSGPVRDGSPTSHTIHPGQVLIGPLILVCAGVALRRRKPLLTLGLGSAGFAGDLVLGGSLGTILIFTVNIYSACIYGPPTLARRLLYVTAFLTAGVGALVFALWRHLGLSVIILAVVAMVLISPVLTAMVVRQHRDRAETERVRADQVARLAELDRRAAIAAERTRMARELHDVIANHFSVITLQATAALSRQDLDARAVREMLATIRENGVRGLDEMRTMIDLTDDQDAVRAGLVLILDGADDIEVVGEAADGEGAVAMAREIRPDVLVMDVRMPRMDGISATRELAGVSDVLILTTFDIDEYVFGAPAVTRRLISAFAAGRTPSGAPRSRP